MKFILKTEDRRVVLRVVAAYALFGFIWIYFSDSILSMIVHNPAMVTRIGILKGTLFVVITSLLLYVLIGRYLSRISETYQQLQQSEERFRMLVEKSTDITFSLTTEGVFTYVSPNWKDAFGYDLAETVGKPFALFVHPDDVATCFSFLRLVLETGEKQRDVEYRVLRKNGTWVWYSANGAHLHDPVSKEASFLGIGRDISRQKLAEESLRHNEALLKESQRVAHVGHYEFDVTSGQWTSSEELDLIFGIDDGYPHDTDGWLRLVCSDQREELSTYLKVNILQGHEDFNREYRIQRPSDRSVRWVHGLGHLEFSADGRLLMFGVLQDITERKRIEEVLSFLANASSVIPYEPFFNALARYLAQSLGMDFVCIDRLEGDGLTARTVAVWSDGHFEDNVIYALKDTPCGDAVGKPICCYPDSVRLLFPEDQVLQDLRAESYVGVTLWSHTGKAIGLIAVIGRRQLENRQLAEELLQLVAVRAAGELERLDAEEALQKISITDELTGLNNRRGFMLLAKQQVKVADRLGKGLVLVYVDIDRMKWINDTYGHGMGDQALIDTASILRNSFRASDIIARIGGDEFVVFSVDIAAMTENIIQERLWENLNARNLESNSPFQLSISYGLTTYDPAAPCAIEDLIERGDREMYKQKQNRNN